MKLQLDNVERLREHAYELQETICITSMDFNDPRMATLSAVANNLTSLLDDWRIDLLDDQDEEEQGWLDAQDE